MYYKIDEFIQTCDLEQIVIAIDGKAGSGKSTLATYLKEKYNASVYCMDDYFLQPHQRTNERSEMIGGNVDFERFLEQVLIPIKNNQAVHYQKYHCKKQQLEPIQTLTSNKIVVIEGSYSMRPELLPYYNLTVAIDIHPELQIDRIKKRNPNYQDFIDKWIPLENNYLDHYKIYQKANIILNNT